MSRDTTVGSDAVVIKDHGVAYYAVEDASFVSASSKFAGAESTEVFRCRWNGVHEKLHLDAPSGFSCMVSVLCLFRNIRASL